MILPSHIQKVDGISSLLPKAPQKSTLRDLLGGGFGFVVFFLVLGILALFMLSRVNAATQHSVLIPVGSTIDFGNSANLHFQDFSVDFWLKTPVSFAQGPIFGWSDTSAWSLWYYANSGNLAINWWNVRWLAISDIVLSPSTWYHIATTSEGVVTKIYINGVFHGGSSDKIGSYTWLANLTLSTSSGNQYIDELRIWNYPLSANNVLTLYNVGDGVCYSGYSPPSGLVSNWHFDEGNGVTASDAIDNNNGTLSGATNWSLDNKVFCAPTSCQFVNCSVCITQNSCENSCGVGKWFSGICHQTALDPICVIGNLDPTIQDVSICVFQRKYWASQTYQMGLYCYDIACHLPPPLPPPPPEIGETTSTIQFVYSDYTNKWNTPTKLFSEITDTLGKLVNPVLTWANNFISFFSVDNAKSQAELLAGSTRTLLIQTKAFDNIFGNLPITAGVAFLVLVILVKGFFVISTKIASFIRR